MGNFRKLVLLTLVSLVFFFVACKGSNDTSTDKELEKQLNSLLNDIVVELKTPKPIELTPRRFIELSSVIVVSNYYWSKELIAKAQSSTNANGISQEEVELYLTDKKQKLLEAFGLTIEAFESYAIEHQKEFQEFIKQNKDLVDKYNTLSSLVPTFEN
jgi:hypothetical protein